VRLGAIYLEQNNLPKAEETFTQLLKFDPDSADGHSGLGDALADQHRDLEALKEYKQAAALDPGQGLYYNMGVVQARLNLLDDAIVSLLKQRQSEDNPDNEKLLAQLYDAKGMGNEAADARKKAGQL
jgi:tetratricopeptide (TPR) repeat protein